MDFHGMDMQKNIAEQGLRSSAAAFGKAMADNGSPQGLRQSFQIEPVLLNCIVCFFVFRHVYTKNFVPAFTVLLRSTINLLLGSSSILYHAKLFGAGPWSTFPNKS